MYFLQAMKTALDYAVENQNTKVVQILSDFEADVNEVSTKQVDILISKNQALQILYLKHCVYKTT